MDRVMPHNIDAEQSVLGSMFLSKYALQKCLENLTKDLFYLDIHQKIYEAISSLAEKDRPIDLTTVTSELSDRKWIKQIGDVDYLAQIINAVPTASNVDDYIKIVEEKAILRRLIEEATEIVTSGYDSTNTIEETLDNAEKKILNVVKTRKASQFKSIQEVLFKTQSDLEKLSQTKNEITGIATGFYDLDRITSGLHENELIIIAARPAMGKTAFALNLLVNMAINTNKPVALFNMEMGAEQLAVRMLSSAGQIDLGKLKNARFDNNDWKRINEAISRLADTKIYIDDTAGMTISEIRAKCRRLASSTEGLSAVIIDYLQLISGSSKYAGQRQQEVSEISRSLKTMAMELNIPVIALAQLSRSVEGREDKRPLLSDLRESGSIEQDADIVAFLYRDDYYNKEAAIDENTSRSEFILAKHRNGPTGTIDLIFKRNTSTFVNVDKIQEDR
ncbi:MAG TPA: replicative DNA helicase [Tenericutes bacterium]|nr:replicative DNA helicase [Mycoplasmatota bacterium]